MSSDKIVVKIDPDLIDLIPSYLNKRKNETQNLKSFLDNKKYDDIQNIGHKLKGNAGGYGFMELGVLGAELESAAGACDEQKIHKLIFEIEAYLENLEITI